MIHCLTKSVYLILIKIPMTVQDFFFMNYGFIMYTFADISETWNRKLQKDKSTSEIRMFLSPPSIRFHSQFLVVNIPILPVCHDFKHEISFQFSISFASNALISYMIFFSVMLSSDFPCCSTDTVFVRTLFSSLQYIVLQMIFLPNYL